MRYMRMEASEKYESRGQLRMFVMMGDVLDIEMGNKKAFLGIGK